ncbi:MAG: DUF542 domain-containing protein [Crocinitomicaceae bacterium]
MKISKESLIAEIVVNDYRTSSIFDEFGIDFYCQGNRTVKEVCVDQTLEPDELIMLLNGLIGMQSNLLNDYNLWPIDKLVDHIEENHHKYVKRMSKEISENLVESCMVHGEKHPELYKIKELIYNLIDELSHHIKKEKLILFPFIRQLVRAQNGEINFETPSFGTILNPIRQMMNDHKHESERFRTIRMLTNNFEIPSDAGSNFVSTYKMIEEFETELHLHIHLKNNILFPRSIEIDNELNYEQN